jgi:hypothetical protein
VTLTAYLPDRKPYSSRSSLGSTSI